MQTPQKNGPDSRSVFGCIAILLQMNAHKVFVAIKKEYSEYAQKLPFFFRFISLLFKTKAKNKTNIHDRFNPRVSVVVQCIVALVCNTV